MESLLLAIKFKQHTDLVILYFLARKSNNNF